MQDPNHPFSNNSDANYGIHESSNMHPPISSSFQPSSFNVNHMSEFLQRDSNQFPPADPHRHPNPLPLDRPNLRAPGLPPQNPSTTNQMTLRSSFKKVQPGKSAFEPPQHFLNKGPEYRHNTEVQDKEEGHSAASPRSAFQLEPKSAGSKLSNDELKNLVSQYEMFVQEKNIQNYNNYGPFYQPQYPPQMPPYYPPGYMPMGQNPYYQGYNPYRPPPPYNPYMQNYPPHQVQSPPYMQGMPYGSNMKTGGAMPGEIPVKRPYGHQRNMSYGYTHEYNEKPFSEGFYSRQNINYSDQMPNEFNEQYGGENHNMNERTPTIIEVQSNVPKNILQGRGEACSTSRDEKSSEKEFIEENSIPQELPPHFPTGFPQRDMQYGEDPRGFPFALSIMYPPGMQPSGANLNFMNAIPSSSSLPSGSPIKRPFSCLEKLDSVDPQWSPKQNEYLLLEIGNFEYRVYKNKILNFQEAEVIYSQLEEELQNQDGPAEGSNTNSPLNVSGSSRKDGSFSNGGGGMKKRRKEWVEDEIFLLQWGVFNYSIQKLIHIPDLSEDDWNKISLLVPGRTGKECLKKWNQTQKLKKRKLKGTHYVKSPWTPEEDIVLSQLVKDMGEKQWCNVAKKFNQQMQVQGKQKIRCGKQCRDRWRNYLNPTIDNRKWTKNETLHLLRLQRKMGNRWVDIGKVMGRTENLVKNQWKCLLKKERLDYNTKERSEAEKEVFDREMEKIIKRIEGELSNEAKQEAERQMNDSDNIFRIPPNDSRIDTIPAEELEPYQNTIQTNKFPENNNDSFSSESQQEDKSGESKQEFRLIKINSVQFPPPNNKSHQSNYLSGRAFSDLNPDKVVEKQREELFKFTVDDLNKKDPFNKRGRMIPFIAMPNAKQRNDKLPTPIFRIVRQDEREKLEKIEEAKERMESSKFMSSHSQDGKSPGLDKNIEESDQEDIHMEENNEADFYEEPMKTQPEILNTEVEDYDFSLNTCERREKKLVETMNRYTISNISEKSPFKFEEKK